jgi:trimethylamine--corrinoid protein Co-methyltransferase
MDMSSMVFSYGSPEFDLHMSAYSNVAHYLHLPMFGTAGCSDSCLVDEQAGIEAALSIALTALAGPNLNHDVGYIEYGSTSSLEFVAINNDVIGMARRLIRGIGVSEETLALDVIDAVGPGGDFLSEPHTLKHFKTETHFPDLIDGRRYEAWQADGSKTMFERANEKVRGILENYEVDPLPQDVVQGVRAIVERADEALR